MAGFVTRMKDAWNAFNSVESDHPLQSYGNYGTSYAGRPDTVRRFVASERTTIASIINTMSVDAASLFMRHCRTDDQGRYLSDMDSTLNTCLQVEANIDQAATAFRHDLFMTIFEEGVAAIVPVDTTINPNSSGGFNILTMRVGRVVGWYPQHVKVNVYDERDGKRKDITLSKKIVAIVQNPLYSIMNEPNSTLQRLLRKLSLLDQHDNNVSAGKLDLIIQLPYVVKSEARKQQALQRRQEIEFQLKGSQYGIAYTDGTESITQLNRPVENTLNKQIEDLTNLLYSQVGLTLDIMNGNAPEAAMLNYYNRTVGPAVTAVLEAMRRTFLTKTARSQGQTIMAFRDPFALVPIANMAEIADKFTRNEILSPNEIRAGMGIKPSQDPKADELKNRNMPDDKQALQDTPLPDEGTP